MLEATKVNMQYNKSYANDFLRSQPWETYMEHTVVIVTSFSEFLSSISRFANF